MAPLSILRRKKKETTQKVATPSQKTLLEKLCEGDTELYRVLSRTLLLNPTKAVKEGIDVYAQRAQEHYKNKDYVRARIGYQVAGQLGLYEGKLAQAQKFFQKAAEVEPNYTNRSVFEFFAKKENAEKAIAVAREYYDRTAKSTQKE